MLLAKPNIQGVRNCPRFFSRMRLEFLEPNLLYPVSLTRLQAVQGRQAKLFILVAGFIEVVIPIGVITFFH